MADHDSDPLLPRAHGSRQLPSFGTKFAQHLDRSRRLGRQLLGSRKKHFIIMAVVALDVVALLANLFLRLIACEMDGEDEPWVEAVTAGLEVAALVFSSLFMLELAACLFSFGPSYLATRFHLFDSVVIVTSFAIDLGSQGVAESIGSFIVVLRLWRLAKISEEVVVGATERMEMMEQQIEELEGENRLLRAQLGRGLDSHDYAGRE
ncbi:hydrogen voltage-gated channel 1 [Drechmeria coniospora]|uniref:Voltage-gated hydrogen channel 1 n=1 Tax=Drechmeria coniospora TaxID=98403 RepID=A0A151GII4_DRECN|nr:hydrogen voltage-gated channel 1 [Drechmeria coniospora]KYK56907.1 hydrogen voltage-gated channel 1 [Drechmeria coniospora]ODA80371.1 hypothetical protein RJ55_03329 [Drechmeria coniospora]